ncbi:MAG TPA: 4a-hydroxytetrahydrobiopterin dehydratase [Arachnia sp.]|nr:4a-hydroxytetrahydrobiopterin dehydratase [Arachnia sp.]HMT86958.1 4a-hydroxytetrahydrobiopterin dehydratase [Arachnia sp.]
MNDQTRLSPAQVATAGLAEWRQIRHTLRARFRTGDFTRGLELINRIGDAAERRNHHPDVTLTYPEVGVSLTSHDVGGITGRDIDLACEISTIAADLGIGHDTSITDVDLALDTDDHTAVVGFYAALLDTKDTGSGDLTPTQAPPMWFQEPSDDTPLLPPASPPQRWHLDVWVPIDDAEARVDAVLAAGGTLVSDAMAPSFWVVEDADGNRSCVCSVAGPLEG